MNLKFLGAGLLWAVCSFCFVANAGEDQPKEEPKPQNDAQKNREQLLENLRQLLKQQGELGKQFHIELQDVIKDAAGAGAAGDWKMLWHGQEAPKVKAAFLGITSRSPEAALAKQLRLPEGAGLVVEFVDDKSPAKDAGLQVHDVLTKFNDQVLINHQQLATLIRMQKPGDKIELTLIREGKEQKISVTLIEKEVMPLNPVRDKLFYYHGYPKIMGTRFGGQVPPVPEVMEFFAPAMEFKDNDVQIHMTMKDGKGYIVAKDRDGKVLYDGNVTGKTEELPKPIGLKIRGMFQMLGDEPLKPFNIPVPPPEAEKGEF